MCAQVSEFFPSTKDTEKESSFNIQDALKNYFYHWPLIIIGVCISFIGVFFYMQTVTSVYNIKATIIIKDEVKAPETPTLKEIDDNTSPNLVESEVEVLKSIYLIEKVVNKLHLAITYQKKDGLGTQDLYKSTPVIFRVLDSVGNFAGNSFTIKIKDQNSFYIKKSDGTFREFSFKDHLINSFGTWELEPTSHLTGYIGKEITIGINDPKNVAEAYQSGLEAVIPNKLSPVIELSLKDNVQQRGLDILNNLINYYNENSRANKNQINQSTLDFIDKRIGSIANELDSSENDLQRYRSNTGITDISSQSQVYLQNAQSNDNKLNEVTVQLNIIESIEDFVNSSKNIQNASASLGGNYPTLNALIEKLSTLQSQHDELLATTPEDNPVFDPINRKIATTKADIKDNINNIKSSLLAAKKKLEGFSSEFESSIKGVPGQERRLIDKTRQKSIKENLYTYLLQKREEVSMSYASTLNSAQVVDYAYSDAVKSQKIATYAVAFLLGLFLPAAFLRGRSAFNNRIINRKEIESATGTSLFGEITSANSSSALIINDKINIAAGEEFRALRTNLNFLVGKQDKGIVVLVTSSIAGEGKSFVSCNLALALAASSKKTVILELDLRRPKISEIFNLPTSTTGISNYLQGESSKENIIQNSNVNSNLKVIGAGPLPEDPSELLGLEEIDVLINWLKEKYDYIIIDSPPINLVTDARILSRLSNVTFFVIRQAYTYKSLLPFIKSLVKEQKFPEMKLIFNSVDRVRYGYGYNYGNEYYHAIGNNKNKMLNFNFKNFLKRF